MISRMKKRIAGGFTLIELMVVVAIIGILAAVAIPAFMKNARKAKTTEAAINIKKMAEGASSYYLGEQTGAGAQIPIAKQFPSTPATVTAPALGACCAGGITKCSPSANLWTDPTWQALKFSMDDPHYYSYSYVRGGASVAGTAIAALADGSTPTEYFFATANGDLNCDAAGGGLYSTFEYMGAIDAKGSVTTSAGMYTSNELE